MEYFPSLAKRNNGEQDWPKMIQDLTQLKS